MNDAASSSPRGLVRRRNALAGLAFVLLACALISPARLWRPSEVLGPIENPQIGEALSWWNGRLDLPERLWDTALVEKPVGEQATDPNGRRDRVDGEHPPYEPKTQALGLADGAKEQHTRRFVYSHFPPMFSFIAAGFVPLFGGVPHIGIVLLLVLPVPILAYRLFLRRTQSALDAAILTLGLVIGTSLWPVLEKTLRGASPYFVNQTLAVIGQLIFLNEFFGKRRLWPAAAGVVVAALSRQLTIAYLLPLAWMVKEAFRRDRSDQVAGTPADAGDIPKLAGASAPSARGGKRTAWEAAPLVLAILATVGLPMILNTLKFGSPLESGYRFLYNDRPEDLFSRDAERHGIFSPHYIPRNLFYMHVGPPDLHTIDLEGRKVWRLRSNDWGTGIWWTTPVLLFLFGGLRRILNDPAARVLLLAVALVGVAQLCYHSTGYRQHGFNRYSLDFVPVLYALATGFGPRVTKRPWMLLTVAWGVLYFGWII